MSQVIVRALDDAASAVHKQRAKARRIWLEQPLRYVLTEAAKPSREELRARATMPPPDCWMVARR